MLKHDVVRSGILEEMFRRVELRISQTQTLNVTQAFALLRERGQIVAQQDGIDRRANGSAPNRMGKARALAEMYGLKNSSALDEAEVKLRRFCVILHLWAEVRREARLKLGLPVEQIELNPDRILEAVRAIVNTKQSELAQ
jgi:hypothetical protein